jgi:hypothetical protein
MSGQGGKDYFDFVKSIGESKSKQEEDRIIAEEVCAFLSFFVLFAHCFIVIWFISDSHRSFI